MDNKERQTAKEKALEEMSRDAIKVAVQAHRKVVKQRFIIALLSFVCMWLLTSMYHRGAEND